MKIAEIVGNNVTAVNDNTTALRGRALRRYEERPEFDYRSAPVMHIPWGDPDWSGNEMTANGDWPYAQFNDRYLVPQDDAPDPRFHKANDNQRIGPTLVNKVNK